MEAVIEIQSIIDCDHCSPLPSSSPWGLKPRWLEKHWVHPNRIQWRAMWEATSVWSARTYHSHRPLPTLLDTCLLSSTPSITNSLDFWSSRTKNSGPYSWRSLARNSCGGVFVFLPCVMSFIWNQVIKKHPIFDLQAVSWRLGEKGTIYSALKWWQISEDDRWRFVNVDSGYTPNRLT